MNNPSVSLPTFLALEVFRFKGTKEKMIGSQRIEGILELTPEANERASLMLPESIREEENKYRKMRGLYEILPLGKTDLRLRQVLRLTRNETLRAIAAEPGEILHFRRDGWGKVFTHRVQKLPLTIVVEQINQLGETK